MFVKTELINRIRDYFNLNIYETKVWLALLGEGVASASKIAEISRVPRSRTYDVLESLEKKGFVIVKLGKPVKFIGVKPNLVLEKFKNNVKREAEEKIKFFSNIKNTEEFIKLEKIYKEGLNPIKREELSAAIRGRINISNYLQDILKNVKNEVIICTNIENIESKMFLFKKTIDSILKSGAKVKIALSGDEGLIKKVEKELNIRIRKVDIEAKFFIIDRKEIIFYLSKDKSKSKDDTAIWINSEFFSNAFAKIFDKAVYGISEKEKLV